MDEAEIEQVRSIVKEELAKVYADRSASTAPNCPFCDSCHTHWMGNNRIICRDCKKTKTIKVS